MSNESNKDAKPESPPTEPTPSHEPPLITASGEPTEPAELGASPEPAPPRRRKRRRKAADAPAAPGVFERPSLDAQGRERPRFLLRFPIDTELEPAIAAFEAGNYALVRQHAEPLAERAESPEVRRAAEELLSRIEPDPLNKLFLAIAVALLLAVASYAYLSGS
jgi:hypothetical protein